MSEVVKKTPLSINALALSLGAIGNLYEGPIRMICFILMAIILIIFTYKLIFYKKMVKKEREEFTVNVTYPTYYMSLLVFSTYIYELNDTLGLIVWYLTCFFYILYVIKFTYQHVIKDFRLTKVVPAWFIVFVSLANISVTSSFLHQETFGKVMFWYAAIQFLIIFPVAIYRLVKIGELEDELKPTYTIFLAGPAVLLTGYIDSYSTDIYNVIIIAVLSLLSLIFIFLYLCSYKKVFVKNFYKTITSYTFPMVLVITSMTRLIEIFHLYKLIPLVNFLRDVGLIFILFVLYVYIKNIYFKKNSN